MRRGGGGGDGGWRIGYRYRRLYPHSCSYTGLVGLRPAFRRSQLDGVAPLSPSKDTVGPMVHSVEDAALLHAVNHGLPPVALPVRSLKGVRFGVVTALQGEDEVQLEVWQSALHTLRRAGATLVEVSLPLLDDVSQATCLSLYEFRVAIDDWLSKRRRSLRTDKHCGLRRLPARVCAVSTSDAGE